MNRAYYLFDIRSVDEEKRIIEGIATTSEEALDGLILETRGIEFALPVPFLYAHDTSQPIGNVISAEVLNDKIKVRIQIASEGIAGFIDEKWRMIKAGIVRGLSIRWKTLKSQGNRILKSRWIELSAVATPADLNATITSIRNADEKVLAALGTKEPKSVVRLTTNPGGVSPLRKGKTMTIAEQITSFEAKRAALDARQDELMKKASEESRSLDATESEEYDGNDSELKQVDEHIARLKAREKSLAARAVPVTQETTHTPEKAAQARQGVVQVRSMAPKGIGMARIAMALAGAKGNRFEAQNICRERWPDSPELVDGVRAVIEAGDTTTSGWASQLVPNAVQTDFLELLRPMTIFGRIQGFRRVPFNVVVPIQSAGGTYAWVGEAAAKPVSALTFGSATLRWGKVAGIIVITQELARFSSPSAEALVRDDMLQGMARYIDTQFVGTAAAVANVSPAGILNGIASTAATGTTAALFRTDMNNMLNNFTANNVDLGRITLLMSSTQALALSLMVTDLGVALFPNIGINGGSILGFPVIVSENVGTKIIGIDASQILVADDGGISIDVSTEASVEMSSTPIVGDTSPITGATLKSLWQNNLVGLRCEKFITWVAGRTAAVEYITGNAYVP